VVYILFELPNDIVIDVVTKTVIAVDLVSVVDINLREVMTMFRKWKPSLVSRNAYSIGQPETKCGAHSNGKQWANGVRLGHG